MDLDLSKKQMDLSNKRHIYSKWPLFFGNELDEDLNVCSICFAALSLLVDTPENDVVKNLLNTSINSLVFLHRCDNEEYTQSKFVYWPKSYRPGTIESDSGTLNQTSLSLSVFEKLDFLSLKSKVTSQIITTTALEKRVEFIIKAIEWILHSQRRVGLYSAWPYAEECSTTDDRPINIAVLPTYYCIKILMKYVQLFSRDEDVSCIIKDKYPEIITNMKKAIRSGINYFTTQNPTGGIGKSDKENEPTYIHSLLALEILLTHDVEQNDWTRQKSIKRYLDYMLQKSPNAIYKDFEANAFEQYRYRVTRTVPIKEGNHYSTRQINVTDDEIFEMSIEAMVCRLAVYCRRCSYQAQKALSGCTMIRFYRVLGS